MSMPASAGRWTVAMLDALPDDGNRYEIIDGELFVTPAPSYVHQRIVRELARLFANYLSDSREAEVMIAPTDVRVGERTSVEPDLFVIPLASGRPVIGPAKLGELLLATKCCRRPPRLSTATRSGRRISGKAVASTGSWSP